MTLHQTDFGTVETVEIPAAETGAGQTGDNGETESLIVLAHATATGPGSLVNLGRSLAAYGHQVIIPALHRYGETWVRGEGTPIDRNIRVASWALEAFPARRRALFGQSMGGLTAVLTALSLPRPVDHLILYEPMLLAALDPEDTEDMEARDWDRALVRAVIDAVGTDGYEAATAGFIEAWNEVAWTDMPRVVRQSILRDADGLAAEMRAVNFEDFSVEALTGLSMPVLLLGGDRSPVLAGRILDRIEKFAPTVERSLLAGLGHMGPVLAADIVAGRMARFLVRG